MTLSWLFVLSFQSLHIQKTWKLVPSTLNNWKRRKLTLLGKINIVRSVGLSKLIYNASVLPVPKIFCDQVNKVTFNFIWNNKIAKIKKEEVVYLRLHFTETESHDANITVESPSEWTSTTPVVETSESIEPNDNKLEVNAIGYTFSKIF